MSQRGTAFIRRAAQRILKDNRQQVIRKRLRGALQSRLRACAIAADIVALTRMNTGIEPVPSKLRNQVIGELRAISLDLRTAADGRIEAIRRLCVLDGIMSDTVLSDSPQDQYIRTILKPEQPEQKPAVVAVDYQALIEAATRKYEEEKNGLLRVEQVNPE